MNGRDTHSKTRKPAFWGGQTWSLGKNKHFPASNSPDTKQYSDWFIPAASTRTTSKKQYSYFSGLLLIHGDHPGLQSERLELCHVRSVAGMPLRSVEMRGKNWSKRPATVGYFESVNGKKNNVLETVKTDVIDTEDDFTLASEDKLNVSYETD